MIKGLDLIQKIKYEMKHNLEYHNQSVRVPIKDLKLLIELAESNQYRLDLGIAKELCKYASALKEIAHSAEDSSCNELALKYEVIAEKALYD